VAFEPEEILELSDHPFYDLAFARGPTAIGLRPRPPVAVLGGRRNERPVNLQPVALPLDPGEALVGQVCIVTVRGYEGVPYKPLVRGGR
jgi:hypothetical protein